MDTAIYKERLLAEKEKLEGELPSVGRRNPSNPNDWEPVPPPETQPEADPVDAADYSEGFDANASIVADLETRYNDVLAALSRIEGGTFGTCEVSGEPIEAERLDADPAARTCKAHVK
jgi:RNA polymerase-binding transcription factor DksA